MAGKEKKTGHYLFIGCIVIGLGLGLAFEKPGIGAVVGVGLGFILKAVTGERSRS